MCMIVTRAPNSNMAASSLHEVAVVYEAFKKAAPTTRIASVLLVRSSRLFFLWILKANTTPRNMSRRYGTKAMRICTIPARSVSCPEQSLTE